MMSKRIVLIALCLLHTSSIMQATENSEIKTSNSPVYAGEVVQIGLIHPDLVAPITQKNLFVENEGGQNILLPFFMTPIDEALTYVTFETPPSLQAESYTLHTKGIYTSDKGTLVEQDLSLVFEVSNSSYALSVFPAVMTLTDEGELDLKVTNKKEMVSITIETHPMLTHPYEIATTLTEGSSRRFIFEVDRQQLYTAQEENVTSFEIVLNYANQEYVVPVFINKRVEQENIPSETSKENRLFFLGEKSISRNITRKQILQGDLTLFNEGTTALENLSVRSTGNLNEILFFSPTAIQSVEANKTATIAIVVNNEVNPLITRYAGSIIVENEENFAELSMEFLIVEGESENVSEEIIETTLSSKEQNGAAGEEFDFLKTTETGQTVDEKERAYGLFIFIILFLIALIVYIFRRKRIVKERPFEAYVDTVGQKKTW